MACRDRLAFAAADTSGTRLISPVSAPALLVMTAVAGAAGPPTPPAPPRGRVVLTGRRPRPPAWDRGPGFFGDEVEE